jgi:beta-N-acetylhexosaminidase
MVRAACAPILAVPILVTPILALTIFAGAAAAQVPVQVPVQVQGPTPRADALLASMSVPEKAGQLFVSWILARADGQDETRARLRQQIAELGLGGVIVSLGRADEAIALVASLQRQSKVPLLFASDFEGGVAARLQGGCDLGNQMLVGATGLTRLSRAMGEITGDEARALGIPWVLAPVLDVNSNPDNPIINVRSFGEDPAAVARLGCAFAQGVRSRGALPCGKHFPGHGDVSTDSHLALPTVPGDGARLRAVELLPFARASQQGLESVMTGHLAVPGLGEDPALPATLSGKVLGDVLRGELGFRGLVVTDALEMGGVKNAFAPGEVAVRALLAGADVLLMPPDPRLARDAVVAAVAAGRVPVARLDDAVHRLLAAKERLGLLGDGPHGPADDWAQRLDTEAGRRTADEIAARGVTLVRDPRALLPLARGAAWTVVSLTDRAAGDAAREPARDPGGEALADELRAQGVRVAAAVAADLDAEQLAAATAAMRSAERLVVALHVRVREFAGAIAVPPPIVAALAAVPAATPLAVVSFGSPYALRQLSADATALCVYTPGARRERAVARALAGGAITGRLPVAIPGVAAAGTGLTQLPGVELRSVAPEVEGVDAALPQAIDELLAAAVGEGLFAGAVCMVARRGRIVATVANGRYRCDASAPPVRIDTPWDLDALTETCALLPAVLQLAARGRLRLDERVQERLPAFAGSAVGGATLRQLLAHSAPVPAAGALDRGLRGRQAILDALAHAGNGDATTGDGGADQRAAGLLAAAMVEAASGQPFDAFVRDAVWQPLGMSGACFVPAGGPPAQAPPTDDRVERGGIVQGRARDDLAWALGGVSGHAGMFATAGDVLRIGVALLASGRGVLPAALVRDEVLAKPAAAAARGLGVVREDDGAFGGIGATGTSLWCDPRRDVCVVLLANGDGSRDGERLAALRRRLQQLVSSAIDRD